MKDIPTELLERFACDQGLSQAILVGWSAGGTTHVVTWGDSLTDYDCLACATGAPRDTAQRERLRPILAQLDASGESTFLDLCELLLLLSERVEGSIKWSHSRVLVHIKQPRAAQRTEAK